MPPALNKDPVSHVSLYVPMNLSIIIHCVIKYCWKYRNKYRRTLENHLNSHIIGMGLLGPVPRKIVFAAMNVYVAQRFEIVLECIRLEPLEKPVVNLHSHMKRTLHDTRLLTNTFFYLFPRLNGINFIRSYMLQTPNQNLNFYLVLSSKRQV